jgi:dihydrodipicolinate synthase/N-acetylneuraminate lyase
MAYPQLEGILMPMPTPFHEDGAVDYDALDATVDFYLAAKVDGLFVLGTHGQGMVLEIDERKKVSERVVRRVNRRVPVVIHAGTANTFSSIELAKHAAGLEVDAIGLVEPYYYPHNDYEIYAHYRRVAAAIRGIPLFIYDNPETTHLHLSPPKVLTLLETVPDICGIKVSFSTFDELMQYARKMPKTLGVFPGSILSLYQGYSLGIRGAIHPPTSPFPEVCVKMYRALKRNDLAEARAAHDQIVAYLGVIQDFIKDHGRGIFFEAMRFRGLPIKRFPRWDCVPFTDEERDKLKVALEKIRLLPALG